jgi:bifunctional DNase/RNase
MGMLQEARIYSLANVGGQAVLVLEEVNGPRLLPVWIGLYEGGSIGMALAGQKFPRPLTHDLMLDALKRLGAKLEKIVIKGLKDSTFYADVYIKREGQEVVLDARPSDSIALAVRENSPIYVADDVFAACPELLKPISGEEVEDFKKKLETMTPEDFFRDLKKKEGDDGKPHGEK